MRVDSVNETKQNGGLLRNPLVMAGTVTALDAMLLPKEAKQAIKLSMLSEDRFVSLAKGNALAKASESAPISIESLKTVAEKAKNQYPQIKSFADKAFKSLGITFVGVTIAVIAGRMLGNHIAKKNIQKLEQKSLAQ